MPSYIELDKITSLPSASGNGRIVLGVNQSGSLSLMDNNGQTTPVITPGVERKTGATGSLYWNDRNSMTQLDVNKEFHIIDTTDFDPSTSVSNYYLPTGSYEGQKLELVLYNYGTTTLDGNAQNIWIWTDALQYRGTTHTQAFWMPFSFPSWYGNQTTLRPDNPRAVWINGVWVIDNGRWND